MARTLIDLTNAEQVTGLLPTANGGTGASSIVAAGICDLTTAQAVANKALSACNLGVAQADTFQGSHGNPVFSISDAASTVNWLYVRSSTTGSPPWLAAISSADTDVGINLVPLGVGTVQVNGVQVVAVAPGANGNVPTSNRSGAWTSAPPVVRRSFSFFMG